MPLKYFFLLFLVTIGFSYSNSQDCSPCSCTYPDSSKLQITCSNGASNIITVPDPNVYTQLKSITSIVIQNATLIDYPQNLCLYSSTLTSLDLSTNKISAQLPQSLLSCLTNLQYFFIYNNLITSIEANAFSSNVNLLAVDLSRNRLTSIPSTLFPSTLTKLNYIDLHINNITSLDAWFFSLPSLNKLYLSSNNIRSFTNTVGFSLANYNSPPSLLTNLNVIDLTNNPITAFDDSILSLYGVCDSTHFQYLIQLLYPMILTTTPLNCNCLGSYNLLTFTSALTNINLNSNLFQYGVCVTPTTYAGRSIFTFATPSVSCPTGVPFSSTSCSSVTTTTAVNSNGEEPLIGAPDIPLASEYQSGLYAPEIAGIVLGLLGFLVLFLILLYCICPIEILACCFTCIPFFYTMCPCKSGVKREKEYDLFISYNRSNTKWVKNKLIPFIHERCLVENFILHYNSENKEQEVFGPYIKDIMSRSSCILFVLSDAFLMKEWNNRDFQLHLRYLVTRERTRFICVQLHDVCDEEVDEYFVDKLQIPQFVSLEDDEFMFWTKLGYHLYTNDSEERVLPVVSSSKYYADDDDRPNDDIDFDRYNINRPIIHLPRQVDPESRNKPAVDERSRGRRALDTFRTTFMGHSSKNTKVNKEQYVAATRQISFEQGRRPSKVEVNLDERWRILDSDHEKEYGMTNVAFRSEEETMTSGLPRIDTKALSAKRSRRVNGDDGYSIRKTDNNLEITMPVAHDVYMSHQVQNKIIRTSSSGYYNNAQQNWNDSESAI